MYNGSVCQVGVYKVHVGGCIRGGCEEWIKGSACMVGVYTASRYVRGSVCTVHGCVHLQEVCV